MSSSKNVVVIALAGAAETTYNQGAIIADLTGSNTIKLAEFVEVPSEYAYDGARPMPPGTYGTQRRVGPSGRTVNFPVTTVAKGNGSGYAAVGDRVPNVHTLLEASGLSGSLSAATWSFTPTPQETAFTSAGLRMYSRGEVRNVSGAYCNFTIAADSAAPPLWTFETQGTLSLPTDVALPEFTYQAEAVLPPKAENIQLDLNFGGSWTGAKVRGFEFNFQREISPRLDLNATTGHAGFALARRAPLLNVTIEAEALSTFNPESIWNSATNGSVQMTIGSAANNIWELIMSNAQIISVVPGEDGPVATWELQIAGYCSDSVSDNDLTLRFR